jgi:hypothetical protein
MDPREPLESLEPLLEELGDPCHEAPGDVGADVWIAGDVLPGLPWGDPWGDADLFLRRKTDLEALCFSAKKNDKGNSTETR